MDELKWKALKQMANQESPVLSACGDGWTEKQQYGEGTADRMIWILLESKVCTIISKFLLGWLMMKLEVIEHRLGFRRLDGAQIQAHSACLE